MTKRSGRRLECHVSLIEEISSFGGVVVTGDGNFALVCRHGAGHVVLVEAIVVTKHRAIADVETSRLVFDH